MRISFDYNKKQVIQALRYHFISKVELKTMIILVNAFAILSFILYTIQKITPTAFLTYALLWIVIMISIWFILPTVVYKSAKTFQHSFSMRFGKESFTLEHEERERSWPYTALKTFKETPNFFHLYFDARSFLLVPKDAFKDLEEMQQLRKLLKDLINK